MPKENKPNPFVLYPIFFISTFIIIGIITFIMPGFMVKCDCAFNTVNDFLLLLLPIVSSISTIIFIYIRTKRGGRYFTSFLIGLGTSIATTVFLEIMTVSLFM